MQVMETTDRAVVIWFAEKETPSRWGVASLVRGVLRRSGLAPWPGIRAEFFVRRGESLLIARPAPFRRPGRRRRPAGGGGRFFRQE